MLPIMVRPNVILKSEFVNIYAFHISLEKNYLLCCSYSSSYEDISILTRKSNDVKLKMM